PPTRLRAGRRWLVENYDLISSAQSVRAGTLGPGEWARSLRGVDEGAWLASDGLVPFLLMLASAAASGSRAPGRTKGQRYASWSRARRAPASGTAVAPRPQRRMPDDSDGRHRRLPGERRPLPGPRDRRRRRHPRDDDGRHRRRAGPPRLPGGVAR